MYKEENNENYDWVVVLTTNTEFEALMYKANLEGADIPVQVLSQVDTTRNFTVGNLAIVKLLVPKEFIEEAKEIIQAIDMDNNLH